MNEVAREYGRLLKLLKACHLAADIDWDNGPVILGMVKALSADVNATVAFLKEGTADEFGWLSEVFAEVAETTRSQKLVDAPPRDREALPGRMRKVEHRGLHRRSAGYRAE